MGCGDLNKDIDDYIEKAGDFAKPILSHLRALVHEVCPEVEEKMRWSFPHFDHKGMMCSMASFKSHCSFGFWKQSIIEDKNLIFSEKDDGMGSLGKISSTEDLPPDGVLREYIKEAVRLNDEGIKIPKKKPKPKKKVEVPDYFYAELKKHGEALKVFEAFSQSHKLEYVEWIDGAKREATREKRMATAIEWIGAGKSRNWKYMK